jgi:hypothetical protein
LEDEYISHPRQFLALGFRTIVDDLADAQEVLLKRSVVVVQVHQTDAEKHFIQTGTTMRGDREHMENFYNAAVYDLQDEIRDNT